MFGPFINDRWGSRGLTTGHNLCKAWVSSHLQITEALRLPRKEYLKGNKEST